MKSHVLRTMIGLVAMTGAALAQSYRYDNLDRLERVLYPTGEGVVYTYDDADNLLQIRPIAVPPAVTHLSVERLGANQARLNWEFEGAGSSFLVQRKVVGTNDWVDGETVTIGLRTTTLTNQARENLLIRLVVVGDTPDDQSVPSSVVRFPSGQALMVTTALDEDDHALGKGTGDSLREILEAAYSGDTVRFAPALSGERILLNNSAQLRVDKDVIIDASPLPGKITIVADSASRVFYVVDTVSVTMKGLTIRGGNAERGGGILNDGVALTLRRCTLTKNTTWGQGAGICNINGGSLRVEDGTVLSDNYAKEGGGIFNETGSSLHVDNATFVRNTATSSGGGIFNRGEPFIVERSSFSGNGAERGGGITNVNSIGLIENTTLSGNGSALGEGGGLANLSLGIGGGGGAENEVAKFKASNATDFDFHQFGVSVALDGTTVLVGADLDNGGVDGSGSAYVYERAGAEWIEAQKLTASDAAAGDTFGSAVALSGDLALVGAREGKAVYFFRREGGQWIEQQILTPSDGAVSFGTSLALAGDVAVVGASFAELAGEAVLGAVYVFRYDGLAWNEEQILIGAAVDSVTGFGFSVAIDGDRFVVGAAGQVGSGAGSAHIFRQDGAFWVPERKLTASDGVVDDQFGISVSISGERVVVGADRNSAAGNGAGAAYIYDRSGGNWTETKLTASDATDTGDSFGSGVGVLGDLVVVGASSKPAGEAFNVGAAYTYRYDGAEWVESRLTPSDPKANDLFGDEVAISGDRVVVTAFGGDNFAGTAYLFELEPVTPTLPGQKPPHASDLILRHCTVANNVGGGVTNASPSVLTLDNTIVANNLNLENQRFDLQGDFTAVGANVVRVHEGALLGGPEPLTDDPILGELHAGGLKPLAGSPVINAGVATANTPSTDQQFSSRPFGPAPEIGALESRLSADVDLLWLTTSAGQLTPFFETSVTEYSVSVPSTMTTAAVRAAKVRGSQTIEVRANGGGYSEVGNKAASPDLLLNLGLNTIEVKVTAQDGNTSKIFTITVLRGSLPEANVELASLSMSMGDLSPSFDPTQSHYHSFVANAAEQIRLTVPPVHPGAPVDVRANLGEFTPVVAGQPSPLLPLGVGANTVEVRVTSEDGGSTGIYEINVSREAPVAMNADLALLSTSAGELSPLFGRGITLYQVTVPAEVMTATVTPAKAQPAASIEVRANEGPFATVASGVASLPFDLHPGVNVIEVKVTAPDGVTEKVYSVMITRVVETLEWISRLGDGTSEAPVMSADGRFVAFSSVASNLVANDTNDAEDVFFFDRQTQTMERVSVNDAGEEGSYRGGGNGHSTAPSLSRDGRYVAFQSRADNLVPNDTNGQNSASAGEDVFVYDRTTRTIERISMRDDGNQTNVQSLAPSISGDGRYVAFISGDRNLIQGFRGGEVNVYVHDRTTGRAVGVGVPFGDTQANLTSLNPAISDDGRYVTFEFHASKNDGNRSYQYRDIYLFHRETRAVERITGNKIGLEADGVDSEAPAISGDGRYVAFHSEHEDFDFFDTNGRRDVFVYDRNRGIIQRVSKSFDGVEERFQDSTDAAISLDGRYVAFQSRITNFVSVDTNDQQDVFVRDLHTGETFLKPVTLAGVQGDGASSEAALPLDGRGVVFTSAARNLDPEDTNGRSDIYAMVREEGAPLALADLRSLASNLGSLHPAFSASVLSYAAVVPDEQEAVRMRPLAADPAATVEVGINGGEFGPLSDEGDVFHALDPGATTIRLRVTAADDETTKTYAIRVSRATGESFVSDNADLAALQTSAGTLEPSFAGSTALYSLRVPNATDSLTLQPSVAEAGAVVSVNGAEVPPGQSSEAIALSVGTSQILVTVVAPDGLTSRAYVLTVTRELADEERKADLASLALSAGELLPAFNSSMRSYQVSVSGATETVTLTPTAALAEATVTVAGEPVNSGEASAPIPLVAGGFTSVFVEVTAPDRSSTQSYVVLIARDEAPVLSANADLVELSLSAGALSPAFAPNTLAYQLDVAEEVAATTVTATAADATATITVNGTAVNSGEASSALTLVPGANDLTIVVKAENGVVKTYVVTVTRAEDGGPVDPTPPAVNVGLSESGAFTLTIPEGQTVDLEFSEDMVTWQVIATSVTGSFKESDVARLALRKAYYRMK